eukprot:GEMP01037260.1.p1 GENE.GEMP01037260.1~~GEMP01037260.1.p1  ORF type:complete len:347 (+),score=56.86 GEMP01037260.1:122-1162(+)
MSVPPEEKPFEVHFPRRTGLRGIADLISCFVIWHYVFWFPPAFCSLIVIAVTLNLLDWNTIAFLSLLYFAQLMGWRPQNKKGVPFWKYGLYTPLLDSACHQMNGTFIREVELDSKERYLFAWAPHGILGVIRCGSGGTLWSQLFPGIFPRWASFSGAFFIPGAREFSLCVGCVDASFKTLSALGESIHLLPGGIREMNLTDPDSKVTYLTVKDRNGFVRLAQTSNLKIVPVFCFGEKWVHKRSEVPWPLNAAIRCLGWSPLYPCGRWYTLMPNDQDMGWVYGHPIETQDRSIEEIHEDYCKELHRIFNTYKKRFGYDDDETLMIVETSFDPRKPAADDDKECKKQQ